MAKSSFALRSEAGRAGRGVVSRSAWITGASGFIGSQLVRHLRRTGWRVAAARARAGEPTPVPKAGAVVFHLAGVASSRRRDLAAVMAANRDLATALYRAAARQGAAGFVFLSSAKVLGEVAAEPLAADAPRRPRGPYAESKAAAEERLLALWRRHRLPLAIVRPPLAYGVGVAGNFAALLRALALGAPLPFADARGPRSFVSATNLADALGAIGAALKAGRPRIRHVTDGQDIDLATLCRALAAGLGRDARLWRLPAPLLRRLGPPRLFEPFRLDARDLSTLHWRPPQTLDAALTETTRWWQREHPPLGRVRSG